MSSNFDEKMPLYYEGNTLGIMRRSFFPQDLRAFYTTVWLRGIALVKQLTPPFGVSDVGLVQFCEDKLEKNL